MLQAESTYTVVVQVEQGVDVGRVSEALNGSVIDVMSGNTYLMTVSAWPAALPAGVVSIEADGRTQLPAVHGAILKSDAAEADWYKSQPSLQLVNLDKALKVATGRGVIIADIDSAVDVDHPALRGHLIAGTDFVGRRAPACAVATNQSSASFLDQSSASFLDQSSASFLDQSSASFLDQSSASFLDQSSASFLDQSSASFLDQGTAAHGHGTMVAGILAAMAPDAMIMPIRAFDDNGCGDTFRIAKAIRYAVANGAQVINMSFGIAGSSPALRAAIDHATRSNVIFIASAGNLNTDAPQAPASLRNVIGTSAVDLDDHKAAFSNYGVNAQVAAPGVSIISAYPGGYYAILSGTSFASPMVAAEAALLRSLNATAGAAAIAAGTGNIDGQNPDFAGRLGVGRIDLLRAVSRY
jgi:subtilisin family serine protease